MLRFGSYAPTTPLPAILAESPFPWLKSLSTAEGAGVLTLASRRMVETGATITTSCGAMESVYLIIKGALKVHAVGKVPESVIVTVAGGGDLISSFTGDVPHGYCVTLVALQPTDLLWLNTGDFQRSLQAIPAFSQMVAHYVAQRLSAKEFHAYAMLRRGVLERVAYAIHTLANQHGQPLEQGKVTIPFALTQSDFAAMIGASRIRVNHALQELKREGVISMTRAHQMVVHDVSALAGWSAYPMKQPVGVPYP